MITTSQTCSDFGFVKVAAAVPIVTPGCCSDNAERIIELACEAERQNVSVAVFPELSVTGYTCADLFLQQRLLHCAQESVAYIAERTASIKCALIIGFPARFAGRLYNCAAVIRAGKICGIVPKTYIPSYGEFYESRWFASGEGTATKVDFANQSGIPFGTGIIFRMGHAAFGIEICEDLWSVIPPSSRLALQGANIIFNLSASNEITGKHAYREELVRHQSARCICGYVYSSCGFGESTTDLVYAGDAMIADNGTIIARSRRFAMEPSITVSEIDCLGIEARRSSMNTFGDCAKGCGPSVEISIGEAVHFNEMTRQIDTCPFIPNGKDADALMNDTLEIQATALATRLDRIKAKCSVIGVSGGLDSTLALIVVSMAYDKLGWDRKGIIGVTMPGLGTTGRTKGNAEELMQTLGITSREISIVPAVMQHFKDIGIQEADRSTAYENSQARERTQILMDISNAEGGIVIGTGDLSESALGWCTFNGDHISMYNVNASIPKTLVRQLVIWAASNMTQTLAVKGKSRIAAQILQDIAETPISPELLPHDTNGEIAQKTEDIIGPYELHDFFIYRMIYLKEEPDKILFLAMKAFEGKYDETTVRKWLAKFLDRFFAQQFKRNCSSDAPKVSPVSFSPRGDWKMPSDASGKDWKRF